MRLLVALLFSTSTAMAATPKKELTAILDSQYKELQSSQKWSEFVLKNKEYFPDPTKKSDLVVNVIKEELDYKGDTYNIGTSFRQVTLNASLERVKTLLSRPDIFKELYGLDEPTAPDSNLQPGAQLPAEFEARIYKRLPSVLPDQDYRLRYVSNQDGNVWFQRVTLVEDKTDFALRETLVIVEPVDGKVVFREIGKLYPLQWSIRALGPQLRMITKSELTKVSKAFKCAVESSEPISKELAKTCWNNAN